MHSLILAGGGHQETDPLHDFTNGRPKALLEMGGRTMLEWVVGALQSSQAVEETVIVGLKDSDTEVAGLQFAQPVHFLPDAGGFMANIVAGYTYMTATWPGTELIMSSSADIPLITGEIVDDFAQQCRPWDKAVYYNLVTREVMEARFPGSRRTYSRLGGLEVAGGDIVIGRPGLVLENRDLLEAITNARKRPWQIAGLVGWSTLLQYLFSRLTLEKVEDKAVQLLGHPVEILLSKHAELAMDADKPHQITMLRRELEASVNTQVKEVPLKSD